MTQHWIILTGLKNKLILCLKLQKLNNNLFNIPDPILLNVFCLLSFLKCKRNVYCIFSVVFVIKIYYSPQYDIMIHIQCLFVQ